MKKSRSIILLAIFWVLLLSQLSRANADSIEQAAQEIYYETLSPFCPGRALADCPTEQATILKAKIKTELKSGKSKESVYEGILKEYGEHLRSMPSMSGWNSIVWLAPLLLLVGGGLLVILKIRAKGDDLDGNASQSDNSDNEFIAKIKSDRH